MSLNPSLSPHLEWKNSPDYTIFTSEETFKINSTTSFRIWKPKLSADCKDHIFLNDIKHIKLTRLHTPAKMSSLFGHIWPVELSWKKRWTFEFLAFFSLHIIKLIKQMYNKKKKNRINLIRVPNLTKPGMKFD